MNQHRILNTCFDCISRFKSTQFPMRKVAKDLIAERKLNSTERRVVLDIIFKWCRDRNLVIQFLRDEIKFFQSMSTQQQENLVITLLAEPILDVSVFDEGAKQLAHKMIVNINALSKDTNLKRLGDLIGTQLRHDYPKDAEAISSSLFARPSTYLAFDRTKITREMLAKKLLEHNITTSFHPLVPNAIRVEGRFLLDSLPPDVQKNIWVMDAGSQMIAEMVKPKPHEHVLDMCAGEGGKAKIITMNPCHYVAVDVDEHRLARAKKRLFGIKDLEFLCMDATKMGSLAKESFDWVLLDAPCSGIGVMRRHPDIIHRLNKIDLDKTVVLQQQLLQNAINLAKPGGRIIYATCSLLKCENEQQIQRACEQNSKLKPLAFRHLVDEHLKISQEDLDKFELTLLPHIHDCDGFYMAALEKARE